MVFCIWLHSPSVIFSVLFSQSVMSNSLQPHGLQHTRPPCLSPASRVYPNSCPVSWWCHPTISPSVIPFSSCLQSFLTSGSFQMSQFFTLALHSFSQLNNILLYGSITCVYPFISCWTFRLCPLFSYYEYLVALKICVQVLMWTYVFISLGYAVGTEIDLSNV